MRQFYTVPLQVEAESQVEAEQKVNKLVASHAIPEPTIWGFLCVAGLIYFREKREMEEAQKKRKGTRQRKDKEEPEGTGRGKDKEGAGDKAAGTLQFPVYP